MRWLLLFALLPFIDFALLVRVGVEIGALNTIALAIGTAFLGVALAKWQGLSTLARIDAELSARRMPKTELGEGMLILIAAGLLILPGFITDAMGLLLLVPPLRRQLMRLTGRWFSARIASPSPGVRWYRIGMHGVHDRGEPFEQQTMIREVFDDGTAGPARPVKYVRNEAADDETPS